jgi:hypothetical protein
MLSDIHNLLLTSILSLKLFLPFYISKCKTTKLAKSFTPNVWFSNIHSSDEMVGSALCSWNECRHA